MELTGHFVSALNSYALIFCITHRLVKAQKYFALKQFKIFDGLFVGLFTLFSACFEDESDENVGVRETGLIRIRFRFHLNQTWTWNVRIKSSHVQVTGKFWCKTCTKNEVIWTGRDLKLKQFRVQIRHGSNLNCTFQVQANISLFWAQFFLLRINFI